jgi:hypothetical protein
MVPIEGKRTSPQPSEFVFDREKIHLPVDVGAAPDQFLALMTERESLSVGTDSRRWK